jgi:hypothetical protein
MVKTVHWNIDWYKIYSLKELESASSNLYHYIIYQFKLYKTRRTKSPHTHDLN